MTRNDGAGKPFVVGVGIGIGIEEFFTMKGMKGMKKMKDFLTANERE